MTARIVAIDGAAGSGKSTLARALARALGLPYVNTGLMYRALTASAIRSGADLDDGRALLQAASGLRFTLSTNQRELEVEGYTENELHTAAVEVEVSRVARHPEVRAFMRDAQRTLGAGGAVMEGRDIATVVFPDAPVKFFLQADPRVRESRRAHDRGEPRPVVAGELRRRDRHDARVNPFEPAPDAVVVDTTSASPDETLERALAICRERFG